MSNTVLASVIMMVAALPLMFIVILLFMFLTNQLVNAFPPEED